MQFVSAITGRRMYGRVCGPVLMVSSCCAQLNAASVGAFQAGTVVAVPVADAPLDAGWKVRSGGGGGVGVEQAHRGSRRRHDGEGFMLLEGRTH